jgi:hypothetical protein
MRFWTWLSKISISRRSLLFQLAQMINTRAL